MLEAPTAVSGNSPPAVTAHKKAGNTPFRTGNEVIPAQYTIHEPVYSPEAAGETAVSDQSSMNQPLLAVM